MKIQCNTKIDKDVKDKAKPILKTLGLSLSTYMNICLHQLIIQGGIPFDVTAKKVGPVMASDDVDKVEPEMRTAIKEKPSAEEKDKEQRKSKTAKALSQFDF